MTYTDTATTPCNGAEFRSTIEGVVWPVKRCKRCKRSTVNGGGCYGENWEATEEAN